MSKTIIRKRSKQKEIDPKFGVSEWDPAELDVRQTRHRTYGSRPPPRGGTWRDQIKEEAYKLRQRQREADSPEFISPHSTTDTMDTDEAQEINKQIMEKIEKEPEGPEYLNIVGEGKYENVGETLDTGATFSTVTEMQAEVEKDQQAYEEIESLIIIIIIIIIIYCLPFFTRLHAVIVSLVILYLMTLITRLHLQSPRAFHDWPVIEGVCP